MLLVLITKKRLRPNFSDVRTTSVGAGIMGIMVSGPFFSMWYFCRDLTIFG